MWNELLYSFRTYVPLYCLFSFPLLVWVGMFIWSWLRFLRVPADIDGPSFAGLRVAILEALLQRRIWRRPLAGLMHACLALSGVLVVASFILTHYVAPRGVAWQASSGAHLLSDLGVLAGLAGLALAGWRRFVRRTVPQSTEDVLLWALASVFMLSLALANGLSVAITDPNWQRAAFLSSFVGSVLNGISPIALRSMYGVVWAIVHGSLFAGALLVPLTKWRHAVAIGLNLAHSSRRSSGALEMMDLEGEGPFGLKNPEHLNQSQLLDIWACVRCGRCSSVCPAAEVGAELNPLSLLMAEKEARNSECLAQSVGETALWQCTMCMACAEVCPAGVEPWRHILDMRRERVLEEAQFPRALQGVFRGIERHDNPWGTPVQKSAIARQAGVRLVKAGDQCELLLWMGCMVAVDPTARDTWSSFARLLLDAGIDVGCLGDGEPCCGDVARRTGNEFLWQEQVDKVVAAVEGLHIERVVSVCPHCVNTLAHEYPEGLWTDVSHALVELGELWKRGIIAPRADVSEQMRVVYHDPCYLARGLSSISLVRQLLAETPGCECVEPVHTGKNAWCCGAGGGQMWMNDDQAQPALERPLLDELSVVEADLALSACPYCDSVLMTEYGDVSGAQDIVQFLAGRWCVVEEKSQP